MAMTDAQSRSNTGKDEQRSPIAEPIAKLRRARAGRTQAQPPQRVPERSDAIAPHDSSHQPPVQRRTPGPVGRSRTRESGVVGLAERARATVGAHPESRSLAPIFDPLALTLPGLRSILLNRPFDEASRIITEGLASALAPAGAQLWLADPTPWSGERNRAGGQEFIPALRLRTVALCAARDVSHPSRSTGEPSDALSALPSAGAAQPNGVSPGPNAPRARPGGLIDEAITTRRATPLFDPTRAPPHPYATEWLEQMGAWGQGDERDRDTHTALETLGTLVAYPLRARGQTLGALVVGSAIRLGAWSLGALEELADLLALATDRDRLLTYSRSQEALAQTVVRQAPVAIAVLTGPEHIFALTNPTLATLLNIHEDARVIGRRLADVTPSQATEFARLLRLDAVYTGGEAQALNELPLHSSERGVTYWNVTSTPLPGLSSSVGGVLVAAVDVTRQVVARLRAQEVAEVAQERIGQLMTLHATSLDVSSQLGADPRELLADILRRSIALLNAHAGVVYARDAHSGDLEVIVSQGLRGTYTGWRIGIGEGLAGRVAQTSQGLYVADYRAYPFKAAIYDDEDFTAVIAAPLIHRGQVVGVLDVLDDVERRIFTDDDLWLLELFAAQAAQAMENARTYVELERAYRKQRDLDHLKDDFIATASHELRTPLTGVQGFLELLLDYHGSRDEPLALDWLKKAAESAQDLAEIAERLLQTSRLDTGRMELRLLPTPLAAIVDDALESARALLAARGSAHNLVSLIDPSIYVHADQGRLKEVIENLVSNALKYSPQSAQVTVRCEPTNFAVFTERIHTDERGSGFDTGAAPGAQRAIGPENANPRTGEQIETLAAIAERPTVVMASLTPAPADPEQDPCAPLPAVIAAAQTQPYVVVTVRDEGMGIGEIERGRLFGRFARLDSARMSQIRGTGLGLYICRQMLRAMSGDIWLAESALGKGSVFAFTLPLAQPVERDEHLARSRDAGWHG